MSVFVTVLNPKWLLNTNPMSECQKYIRPHCLYTLCLSNQCWKRSSNILPGAEGIFADWKDTHLSYSVTENTKRELKFCCATTFF